ncbi:alpha/beta hydrolase family protein [Streptomyces sp. NPDC048639]|uniref:alpha/beta hydrolase family protein n=1 Tax=Streptomyces sp. NPDC048639 TaxID=3365581 RepID=UPI003717B535
MLQFSEDPLFQMFAERALTTITRGGAEYGECAAVMKRIPPGDNDAWHREWTALAARVAAWGGVSAARGHRVSAREAFLRATTYDRISYYPLFGHPVDPRLTEAFDHETKCFARFAELAEHPVLPVEVPFEGTELPGRLCLPRTGPGTFPTVIGVNGYDSNIHEMYWSHAVPAVRRGYACLLVDGPGQGQPLVKQGLPMRPDWETVLSAVVDRAVTLPQVDGSRLVVQGWSFGGYLAPRGTAGEARVAALIVDPGQWDQLDSFRGVLPLPAELKDRLPDVDPAELDPHLAVLEENPVLRWKLVQRGLWVHGLETLGQYVVEMGRFRLSDVVDGISCPTLVASAEGDAGISGAERLYDALRCRKERVHFTEAEGASGHCEGWNRSRFDQRVYDWLDEVLGVRPS